MAGKIPKETKEAIIRAYSQGGKSKAQLAREYEVSVSSITRIVAGAGSPETAGKTATSGQPSKIFPSEPLEQKEQISQQASAKLQWAGEIEKALSEYGSSIGAENAELLTREFISWISRRDKGEKELISLEMAIESLKLERSSIENEISRLGSKAGSLEILIGKMKKLAEDSQMDLSLVEERLANIEEKLAIDRDILLLASAIRIILRGEELDDELVAMIAEISRVDSNDYREKQDKVRKALTEYSDFFRRRIMTG